MKWIPVSSTISVKATSDGYLVRTVWADDKEILIPNDVLEKLREQEWELDSSQSKRK
jgi:hypothetical protein